MRKALFLALVICFASTAFAQLDTVHAPKPVVKSKFVPTRSNDHIVIQMGYLNWSGKPDSINTTGFPRTLNVYVMLDFPFKTDPHWSVAIGPGIAADNMYFDKTYIGIKDATPTVVFDNRSDTSFFKKYKLATAFLEAPVELRYRFNPLDDAHSVKIAVGAKVGTLLNAKVKGKDLQNSAGNTILPYIDKESSKKFFNKTRLSLEGRVGYGHFSVYASYAVTPLFKEGQGPIIRPWSIGLTISGL